MFHKSPCDLPSCEACGKTPSVQNRIVTCGCGQRQVTHAFEATLRRLAKNIKNLAYAERDKFIVDNQHLDCETLASHLGVSKSVVYGVRSRSEQVQRVTTPWTKDEDEFIFKNKQLPWAWVADQLGRSVVAVRSRAKRIGAEKYSKDREGKTKKIIPLIKQGYFPGEIAKMMGISGETVRVVCRSLDIDPDTFFRKKPRSKSIKLGYPDLIFSEALVLFSLGKIVEGNSDKIWDVCNEVCDLNSFKRHSFSTVKTRLSSLKKKGLVKSRRKGRFQLYSKNDE